MAETAIRPERIRQRLGQPLPGNVAQRRYAPELSYGRHAGPPGPGFREAAVVALCFPRDGAWRVVLTLRPRHLPQHPGQVCFPGGELESGETLVDCALRELQEELGVNSGDVQVLGALSPIYVFASHFLVTPFVGWLPMAPELSPDHREVAEVIELPLSKLLPEQEASSAWIERRGLRFRAPHFQHEGHSIWGATSMILGELGDVLWESNSLGGTVPGGP